MNNVIMMIVLVKMNNIIANKNSIRQSLGLSERISYDVTSIIWSPNPDVKNKIFIVRT